MKTAQFSCPPGTSLVFPGYCGRRYVQRHQGLEYLVWIIWFLFYIEQPFSHYVMYISLLSLCLLSTYIFSISLFNVCLFSHSYFLMHFSWVWLSPFCDLVEKILFGRCWEKTFSSPFIHEVFALIMDP